MHAKKEEWVERRREEWSLLSLKDSRADEEKEWIECETCFDHARGWGWVWSSWGMVNWFGRWRSLNIDHVECFVAKAFAMSVFLG